MPRGVMIRYDNISISESKKVVAALTKKWFIEENDSNDKSAVCMPRQYVNTERKSVAAQRLFGFRHHDLRQFLRQLQKNLLLI